MKKFLLYITFLNLLIINAFSQTLTYKVPALPVQFNYLTDFTVQKEGSKSYTVAGSGGEQYTMTLYKASARFNADSLRYLFTDLYSGDDAIENIQVNEVGSGKMGNLDAERVRITFMSGGSFYTATCVLIRFHLNRKYNSFLIYYEMADRNQNNAIRFDAVKKGFDDLCSSFSYTDFAYLKYDYIADSVKIEYPDFWYAGTTDSNLVIDDGRCKINLQSYSTKDSTTSETFAKAERDRMKKNSALFPGFKGGFTTEKWRNDELCTKFSGTYEKEEFGARKPWYFETFIIRRIVGKTTKEFRINFECYEIHKDYYREKFDIIFKSLILPGVAAEVKK